MAKKRDYRREYDTYQGTPEQRKRNDDRKQARRKMVKAGKVRKGQDVDHISRSERGGLNNSMSNLRAQSPHVNRGRNH
jgi:hypothetical protein